MSETIAVVIVTYNRKALLMECIDGIFRQSRPVNKIILIDNASSDGTYELLIKNGYLTNPLFDYVRLPVNTGGSGGFHEGVKRGFEAGYDWLWLMDDDGVPDTNCLKILAEIGEKGFKYVAPNLLDNDGISHFQRMFENSLSNIINDRGGPFNGILINHCLIAAVGYPMKNYFLWGDEYEYTNRIWECGVPMVTVRNAVHKHKSTKFNYGKCPRSFYLARNSIYNYRLLKGIYITKRMYLLRTLNLLARLMFFGIVCFNLNQVVQTIKGVFSGIYDQLYEFQVESKWPGINNKIKK